MKLQKLAQSYYINRIRAIALFSRRRAAAFAFDIFCWPFTRVNYKLPEFYKKAEQLELNFENLTTKGYRWNKGGTRKIYIAHGFRSSAVNFGHFAKKLVAKGYEVIAFDAPGHGLSEGKRITALIYKRFIEMLNDKYGPFDGYLAHSFGGLGSAFTVAEIPENENIKIALVAPASDTYSLSKEFFRQMKMKDPELQRHFIEVIERISNKPIDWFTISRCMQTIRGDVLWIHDKTDKITPVDDAYIVRDMKFPNLQFEFTEGLGHRKIYRDEKVVQQIVDFL